MRRDERRTIHATANPDVAVRVASSTITREVVPGVWLHVRVEVTLVVVKDRPRETRPRAAEDEDAFDVRPMQLLAARRVKDNRVDAKEWHCRATRLSRDRSGERRDGDTASLGLPERVDDGALATANDVVVPVPSLGVDRFTDGTHDANTGEVVAGDMCVSESTQQANGSRRGVELGDFVLCDALPIARGRRVDRRRFENGR